MRAKGVGVVCFAMALLAATFAAAAASSDLRLVEASKRADEAAVKALVAAGVDVNAQASDGATALHWSAEQGALAAVDLLLRKGANVNAATDLGITPLWIAANNSSTAIIARLLEAGADPNIAPPTNGTPLMNAARRGNADAVKAMLARGADPNVKEDASGQTALMWAAAGRHPDVVRLLLAAKADVKARTKSYMQRVMLCCQYYEHDERGIGVVARGGFTPLFFAAHAGHPAMMAALLEAGADANSAGAGYTALHVAATRGDVTMVRTLLAHNASINARQQKGSPTKRIRTGHSLDWAMTGATPYLLAVRGGNAEVMRLLAASGADTSLPLADGRTALMVLAGRGTENGPVVSEAQAIEILKLAVQLGTKINQADVNGDTALHVAATRRRDELVQALVDTGAALNARNIKGETPLTAAIKPPAERRGSGISDDYEYIVKHTSTAALLRKLGAKT